MVHRHHQDCLRNCIGKAKTTDQMKRQPGNNVLGMVKREPPVLETVFSKSKCVVMTQLLDTRPGFVK